MKSQMHTYTRILVLSCVGFVITGCDKAAPTNPSTDSTQISALESRLATLEARVNTLEQQRATAPATTRADRSSPTHPQVAGSWVLVGARNQPPGVGFTQGGQIDILADGSFAWQGVPGQITWLGASRLKLELKGIGSVLMIMDAAITQSNLTLQGTQGEYYAFQRRSN